MPAVPADAEQRHDHAALARRDDVIAPREAAAETSSGSGASAPPAGRGWKEGGQHRAGAQRRPPPRGRRESAEGRDGNRSHGSLRAARSKASVMDRYRLAQHTEAPHSAAGPCSFHGTEGHPGCWSR